jgi:predicted nucleic acid-binding Zn ribbon protein
LEGVLKNIISGLGGKGRMTEEEMAAAWRKAAGRKAAARTKVVSFRKSVLTVNADDSSWLYELTMKKREILKKLGGKLAGKKLKDIRFRIGEVK